LAYRTKRLQEAAKDITPKNGAAFPWTGQEADAFESEWAWKPVALRGFFDHDKEIHI